MEEWQHFANPETLIFHFHHNHILFHLALDLKLGSLAPQVQNLDIDILVNLVHLLVASDDRIKA